MKDVLGDNTGNNLFGTDDDEAYFGFDGFDLLFASRGDDTLNGGRDENVALYNNPLFTSGVFINNTAQTINGVAAFTVDKRGSGTDTLIDIANFHGSNFDDVIYIGGLGGTYSFDEGGNDRVLASQDPNATDGHNFLAGSGADTLIGTVQDDRIDYDDAEYDPAGPLTQGAVVDLAAGTGTDGWGFVDTLVSIEDVTGSPLDDTIIGDQGENDLSGGEGNDLIDGRAGGDFLQPGLGQDTVIGGANGPDGERDELSYIFDSIYQYPQLTTGITATFTGEFAGTVVDPGGDTDSFTGIEMVRGTNHDDSFTGAAGRQQFRGFGGDDYFDGGAGDRDRVDYSRERSDVGSLEQGIVANLTTGIVIDTYNNTDTLVGIEEIRGSDFDDEITGDENHNEFQGEDGDDLLKGLGGGDRLEGGTGNDTLEGGAGRDTLSGGAGDDTLDGGANPIRFSGGDRAIYDDDHNRGGTQGIVGNLATNTVIDTFGDTDTLIDIEEIHGSVFNDTLISGAGDDALRGRDGNDTIFGGAGNDDLSGGNGNDTLDGGAGGDFLQPGLGADTVIGGANGPTGETDELSYIFDSMDEYPQLTTGIEVTFTSEFAGTVVDSGGDTDTFTGIESVRGTNNADSFIGTTGRQEFRGFGGDDYFDGGAGDRDRVDYSRDESDVGSLEQGIVANLSLGTVTDTYGDMDTLVRIEEIRGSRFDDEITGDANRNELQGEGGDDLIDSFGGERNFLSGDGGNDTLKARGDQDYAKGGDGNDLIELLGVGGTANPGLGSDTVIGGSNGFFDVDYDGVGVDLTIDTALGKTTFAVGSDEDSLINIRNVGGGDGDDTLLGDDGTDWQEFFSSRGDDFIDGRGGGLDWLIYDTRDVTAVTVDFSKGTATGTLVGNDTFANIEAVRGTSGADTFIGGTQAFTRYRGLDGVDSYTGGTGIDRLDFSFDDNRGGTLGIAADIAAGTTTDAFGNAETFTGIEQIQATVFDDTLAGDGNDNVLIGMEGDDLLTGLGGDDGLYAGEGADTITSGAGADTIGGRVFELDGDIITDLGANDVITVFDENFDVIAADLSIVGNQLRIDTDGDGVADASMTLTNGYSGPVTSEGGGTGNATATVFSVENAGQFTAVVGEASVAVPITITRSGDISTSASVMLQVAGSGAHAADASDITSPFNTPIQVNFAPGQTSFVYEIDVVGDADIEADEDLAVTLSNPTSSSSVPAEIKGGETFVRILNDDLPATVNISGGKAREDSGALSFTVSRTGDVTDEITVHYAIASAGGLQGAEASDLIDGLPQNGTVVIPAGAATAIFSLAIAPDTLPELHDDVIATISAAPDWPAGLSVGAAQAIGSIRNDDGVPPVIPLGATGANFGDPHIVTLDGLAYDFQAVGEFTLIKAQSGDALNVQVRFEPVAGSMVASQTSAVATEMGGARVVIDSDAEHLVLVNGAAFDLETAVGGQSIGNGDIYFDGEAITVVYANGEQLRVDLSDGFLSTSVSIAAGRDVNGLLGNADGDTANDLALPDGTVLTQPLSFVDLYGTFADAWRITDSTSLFEYGLGLGTADFTDLSFPQTVVTLDDLPLEIVAAAEAAVSDIADPVLREAALIDYLLSGNADFIAAAAGIEETTGGPAVQTSPTDTPVIAASVGVSVSDVTISEGDSGTKSVLFTVYRLGDTSDALTLDYVIGGDVDASDVAGPLAGSIAFGVGEKSQEVTVEITGDAEVEDSETLEFAFTVTGGSTPTVLSSIATVTIQNDDIAPPDPVLTYVSGTGGSDDLRGTEGADVITGLGGAYDRMTGNGGADQFVFGGETSNGIRERDVILDYEAGVDAIVLTDGAAIAQIRETSSQLVIFFEEDRDALYVRGDGLEIDDLTILTEPVTDLF